MIRDPAACFAQALAALDGAPVPLTAGGSKTLYYMLDGPQGCDAWLTLKATTDQITIQIREATALELSAPPLFAPPDLRPKYIEGTEPCPSCGVVPDRYRELRDGALVCLACGASRKGSRSPSP